MSCLQIALERAEIKVDKYIASEIDAPAMKIAQKNYPNTIQLGSVTELTNKQLKQLDKIDLLGGGSPCQNLSQIVAGDEEHNQGLEGEKSKLFYDYARALNVINPSHFLYENVASMKDKDKNIISQELGVEPIMICSSLVSGQERERYYWTNIQGVTQPEDRKISLGDILEDQVDESYYYDITYDWFGLDKKVVAKLHLFKYDMLQRVYNPKFKAPTLTRCNGGHKQKKVWQHGRARRLTPLEYERLQTVPHGYTDGVANGHRYNMLGNGWTVDVISHILSFMNK